MTQLTFLSAFLWVLLQVPPIFLTDQGQVSFRSEAPLETIEASSNTLRGAVNTEDRNFAFVLNMNAFRGFNDPLQREHFCEKFLECGKFPESTFSGKFIEKLDFSQMGKREVRAKGTFSIHGVERERIIRGTMDIRPDGIRIVAGFSVKLADHNIKIPLVVHQNVAEEIQVRIDMLLTPKAG
ncbi:MAG: YceI family protein [Bacteroidota bacterium]